MTTDDTAAPATAAGKRRTRRRRPSPFPVTIVRPAATPVVALTAVQLDRRRAASQLAAHLTDATARGFTAHVACDYWWPLRKWNKHP